MKFLLISIMLANPMSYADKATCEIAADALKSVDVEAVCIPAGMQKMIKRLEKMKLDLSETK